MNSSQSFFDQARRVGDVADPTYQEGVMCRAVRIDPRLRKQHYCVSCSTSFRASKLLPRARLPTQVEGVHVPFVVGAFRMHHPLCKYRKEVSRLVSSIRVGEAYEGSKVGDFFHAPDVVVRVDVMLQLEYANRVDCSAARVLPGDGQALGRQER